MLTFSQGTRAARWRPAGAVPRPFIRDLIHGDLNRAFGASGFLSYDLRLADTVRMAAILGHNIASDKVIKLQGGPVPQEYALSCGSGESADITAHDDIRPLLGDFAVAVRIKFLTAVNVFRAVFSSGTSDVHLHLGLGDDSRIYTSIGDGVTNVGLYGDAGGSNLSVGIWYAVVANFDRDGNMVIYLDDSSYRTKSIATVTGSINSASNPTIGSKPAAGGHATGNTLIVDELRVYKRLLTAAEITAYSNGTLAATDNLGAYLKFDDGSGDTAADSSGNNHPATKTAGATWTTAVHSPLDETITWVADKIFHTVVAPASYRYWRMLIESPAGTETMKKILLLNRALGAFEKGVA